MRWKEATRANSQQKILNRRRKWASLPMSPLTVGAAPEAVMRRLRTYSHNERDKHGSTGARCLFATPVPNSLSFPKRGYPGNAGLRQN